jgi:NADPH-dependent glutamate synthase beta subunit-like oxidoreductase
MDSQRYKVEIPDYSYWKRQIKCQDACPVHTDARGYVKAIGRGEDETGYLVARAPNPLASICGNICGAPCETACRRGSLDQPVAIRALKRFVTDQHGADTHRGSAGSFHQSLLNRMLGLECCDAENLLGFRELIESRPLGDKKVAIVGSGPGGLAAAHDLALMGAEVTVFEMEAEAGGMLALGVPEYRLRREIIQAEVAVIRSLGVRVVADTRVGGDITLSQLRETSDAVIIAVGAKRSRTLPIPGIDAAGVMGGVEFLRAVALGQPVSLGQKVIVIGGGNVAYDVARTVLRQVGSDISRVALRQPFVKEVHLCCLESLEEMPADDVEILEGEDEGVTRHNGVGPKEIVTKDGKVTGLVFMKCLSAYDENKRFAPVYDEKILSSLEADTIIVAVGQGMDLSCLEGAEDISLTERRLVEVDPETQMTTAPGVFVAGDSAHGTKLLIDALESGKRVARSVFRVLTGKPLRLERSGQHEELPNWGREKDYEKLDRTTIPIAPAPSRVRSVSAPVELGYDSTASKREAARCLDCGVNTIFDGDKCILCGGCADVCPEMCLKLVPATSLDGGEILEQLLQVRFQESPPGEASAIIKDEDRCIRCGLCAERCPTGAITMERFTFEETWHVG